MVWSENYCINYDRDQSSVPEPDVHSYNNGYNGYILKLCTFLSSPAKINDQHEMAPYWFPCISDSGNRDGNLSAPLSNVISGHQPQ